MSVTVTKNIAINTASAQSTVQVDTNLSAFTNYTRPIKTNMTDSSNIDLELLINFGENALIESLGNIANGDIVGLLNIPAGMVVEDVSMDVIIACQNAAGTLTTATLSLSDGSTTANWMAATTVCTAAITLGAGVNVAAGGKLYTTADQLIATFAVTSGPIVSGLIRIKAWGRDAS